ncbi:2-oxo acid dehydrogenase subunit E2 [Rhodophyticola sp. CCM32]|uniref:2-oxo acid dehydrogenase subunit E2 n=1 Tax=Rhodophyticola sp. CCM32 TaxID=2916397 RepID=UPI001EE5F188|nr:2-oxo acid dehydrogenase subunit E2 [Rhodophyticola sp. CCM32]
MVRVPQVNAHVSDTGITRFDQVDIAMAVAVEDGLLAPLLRNVAQKRVTVIAAEARELPEAARARDLTAGMLDGATFTLSNLGMYGVRSFDAIVTAPQAATLALGGTQRVAVETAEGGVAFATDIRATLSADHRAIDGALAAQFLAALRDLLETPLSLMH